MHTLPGGGGSLPFRNLKRGVLLGLPSGQDVAKASEQLENILARRPRLWMQLRADVQSDKAADRAYEATEDGIMEMRLRMRMKAIEKKMSAIKSLLDVLMGESRNNF